MTFAFMYSETNNCEPNDISNQAEWTEMPVISSLNFLQYKKKKTPSILF